MIPDFFIVGATKCATFTIHEYLDGMESVQMSKDKEPYTFCSDTHLANVCKLYEKQYDDDDRLKGESNANNLVIKYVPERIHILNPNAKIIVLTRDPVRRAYSHWKYMRSLRPGMEYDFRKAIRLNAVDFNLDKFELESDYVHTAIKEWGNSKRMYLETGYYEYYIAGYRKYFDVLVLNVDDLKTSGYKEICDFLKVEYVPKVTRDRNVKGGDVYADEFEVAESLRKFYKDGDLSHLTEL